MADSSFANSDPGARDPFSPERVRRPREQVEHQIQLIATAATQQTSASSEISESAGHISQLATENSHGAEEAVEALKNLASMANDLDSMINQFQLENTRQPGGSFLNRSKAPLRATQSALA